MSRALMRLCVRKAEHAWDSVSDYCKPLKASAFLHIDGVYPCCSSASGSGRVTSQSVRSRTDQTRWRSCTLSRSSSNPIKVSKLSVSEIVCRTSTSTLTVLKNIYNIRHKIHWFHELLPLFFRLADNRGQHRLHTSLRLVDLFSLFSRQLADVLHHHCDSTWCVANAVDSFWWFDFISASHLMPFFFLFSLAAGKLCFKLSGYLLWPFGKALQKVTSQGSYALPNHWAIYYILCS